MDLKLDDAALRQAALRQRRVEHGDTKREDALGTLKIERGLQLGGRFESSCSQSPLCITPSSRRFRSQAERGRMRPGSVKLGAFDLGIVKLGTMKLGTMDLGTMDLGTTNRERCCGERHD